MTVCWFPVIKNHPQCTLINKWLKFFAIPRSEKVSYYRTILKMWQNKGLIQFYHSGSMCKLAESYHNIQLIVDFFTNKRDLFIKIQFQKATSWALLKQLWTPVCALWIFCVTFVLKLLCMMHLGPWKIMPSWTASSAVMMKYRVISTGTEAFLSGQPLRIMCFRVSSGSPVWSCSIVLLRWPSTEHGCLQLLCLFQIFLALPHWDSDMLVIGYLQGASLGLGDI